jgi:hypothetical protein
MSPNGAIRRPGRMTLPHASARLLIVLVVLVIVTVVPTAQVAACSCGMLGKPAEVVRASDITFIGTAVDTAPGEPSDLGGSNVRYAFDVERATAATDPVVVVQALDDGGGASCGFTFGLGERWLVAAYRHEGDLETNLCSGNRLADELPAEELAAYQDLMPEVPPEPAEPAEPRAGSDLSIPAAILIGAMGAVLLGGVTVLATRRRNDGRG